MTEFVGGVELPRIGAIDQYVDSPPVLGDVRRCREIARAARREEGHR